jgi:hypothetical protein
VVPVPDQAVEAEAAMSQDMLELISLVAGPILPQTFAVLVVFVAVVTLKGYFPKE